MIKEARINNREKTVSLISVTGKKTASQIAQWVKNLPAMQEMQAGRPLEEAQQPTPAFLPGDSHGQKRLAGQSIVSQRVRHS